MAERFIKVAEVDALPPGKMRLTSFALGARGRTWTWRGAGRLAGNMLIEGDRLEFQLSDEGAPSSGSASGAGPAIVRASLDLETGEQWLMAPLAPNTWTPASLFGRETRARIFPGLETWRVERDRDDVYWAFAHDRQPLRVTGESGPDDCHIVVDDQETTLHSKYAPTGKDHVIPVIACKETAYESIGGGVILIKDFAGGLGLERVIKDPRIGLWR